jgi:hypothetical protein
MSTKAIYSGYNYIKHGDNYQNFEQKCLKLFVHYSFIMNA